MVKEIINFYCKIMDFEFKIINLTLIYFIDGIISNGIYYN